MSIIASRRGFLGGLAAALAAPAIMRVDSLMKLPPVWARKTIAPAYVHAAWLDPALGLTDLDLHALSQKTLDAIGWHNLVVNIHDYDPAYARQLARRIAEDEVSRWVQDA